MSKTPVPSSSKRLGLVKRNSIKPRSQLAYNEPSQDSADSQSSNIKCFARFRPLNSLEAELGHGDLSFESNTTVVIAKPDFESFHFSRVFAPEATQLEVYLEIGKPSVIDVVSGYNATVFAYGQSGSGKTHTMMGEDAFDPDLQGVIPRAIIDLFAAVMQQAQGVEFTFRCSLLEVYKEKLRDLFDSNNNDLRIKESPSRGIYVENLTELSVGSEDEMLEALAIGESQRTVASTKLNAQSSRSHQLFIVDVRQKMPDDTEKRGVLNLVDLAGSEKIRWSGVTGNKLEEAKKINLSLSALGNVIKALANKGEHVPYRDSKLTRLLQESLGGNFKTYLVVACSPSKRNLEETLSTLRFGKRAGVIKNKVTVNIKMTPEAYQRVIDDLKAQLMQVRHENRALKAESLEITRGSPYKAHIITRQTSAPTQKLRSPETSKPDRPISSLSQASKHSLGSSKPSQDSLISETLSDPHEICEQAFAQERARASHFKEQLDDANQRIKELEDSLSRSKESHLAAEQRACEFSDSYHKLSKLIDKDSEDLISLRTSNKSLQKQVRYLTKSLTDLDAKFYESLQINRRSRSSTYVEFENCDDFYMGERTDQFLISENSSELSSLIDIRGIPIGSFLLTQPLSSPINAKMEKNTELSREILVFNLRNQVIHSGLINANLVRRYHALDWKYCLVYSRYEEKLLQVESLKQRVKAMEELVDHQHQSYSAVLKLVGKIKENPAPEEHKFERRATRHPTIQRVVTKRMTQVNKFKSMQSFSQMNFPSVASLGQIDNTDNPQPQSLKLKAVESNLVIQQGFSEQLKKALEDANVMMDAKDQAQRELEQRVYIAHKQETESWRQFVTEFRDNLETEINRKHAQVAGLSDVLGVWIHRYMDLQQTAPSANQRIFPSADDMNDLILKTKATIPLDIGHGRYLKLEGTGLDVKPASENLMRSRGDFSPPATDL